MIHLLFMVHCRDLRCLRNTIHANLFVTHILSALLWMLTLSLQVSYDIIMFVCSFTVASRPFVFYSHRRKMNESQLNARHRYIYIWRPWFLCTMHTYNIYEQFAKLVTFTQTLTIWQLNFHNSFNYRSGAEPDIWDA